jgi:hypothetical protein
VERNLKEGQNPPRVVTPVEEEEDTAVCFLQTLRTHISESEDKKKMKRKPVGWLTNIQFSGNFEYFSLYTNIYIMIEPKRDTAR